MVKRSCLYINAQLYHLFKITLKYEGWRRIIKYYIDYKLVLKDCLKCFESELVP